MALRQFADQSREIQHALALVGGINTIPEAHALHGRGGGQRLSEKNDIVLVLARVFAESRGSAREHDHARRIGKSRRKCPFNFVHQSGGIGFLIPEDDIAALNQRNDIHATDAFKAHFEVAHPDDVAPTDIDAAKQCKVVAGCHENSLYKRSHLLAANSVSTSRSFWAEQRATRRKFSDSPANAKAKLALFSNSALAPSISIILPAAS